jgi:hypothetical protein
MAHPNIREAAVIAIPDGMGKPLNRLVTETFRRRIN